MPSRTASPPLTLTLLAALWLSVGRCDGSRPPGPRCDSGKLYLDRDLPVDAVHWDCQTSTWPESTQRLPSVDTVYDAEPARQICMDKSISYSQTIPNSGEYRPVRAESGEYLYCPPQRWLNNLHHEATVLLYHPCTPLHERRLLSVLARSCLRDYVITPHPELSKHTPLALVSWGRTLELSTVASSDVCDWLDTVTSKRNKFGSLESPSWKYNLMLTLSAEQHVKQHPQEYSPKMKESLRQCCELTISSLLNETSDSNVKKENLKDEGKIRHARAAIKENREDEKSENKIEIPVTNGSIFSSNQTSKPAPSRTEDLQNYNSMLEQSADSPGGNRTLLHAPESSKAPSQAEIDDMNQGLTPRLTSLSGSNVSKAALESDSSGFAGSESLRSGLQTAAEQPRPKQTTPRKTNSPDDLSGGVKSKHTLTAGPQDFGPSSKDEGTDQVRHRMNDNNPTEKHSEKDGMMKDNEVVDVQERELEYKPKHNDSLSRSEKTGFDSVSKSQHGSLPQPPQPSDPQPAGYLPSSHGCEGCKEGQRCECNKASGTEVRAAVVNTELLRTPRTDEAVWAAAALGFLLVLLTLSVLHTRLYRHWRTTPSLYWHDPQQDYDSVADVIRTRLRIAKRRRKRVRRQECVLLPSSSSSDEHP